MMLGAWVFRGVRVVFAFLAIVALALGGMSSPTAYGQTEGDSQIILQGAVGLIGRDEEGYEGIAENTVTKENIKDTVANVWAQGLTEGDSYVVEVVAFAKNDSYGGKGWDTKPMTFQVPPGEEKAGYEMIVMKSQGFTAGKEQDSSTLDVQCTDGKCTQEQQIPIGQILELFTRYCPTWNQLVKQREVVLEFRLREVQPSSENNSMPLPDANRGRRELQLNPILATYPKREDGYQDNMLTVEGVVQEVCPKGSTLPDPKPHNQAPAEDDSQDDGSQPGSEGSQKPEDQSGNSPSTGNSDDDANTNDNGSGTEDNGNTSQPQNGNNGEGSKPEDDNNSNAANGNNETNNEPQGGNDSGNKPLASDEQDIVSPIEPPAPEGKEPAPAPEVRNTVKAAEVYGMGSDGKPTRSVTPGNLSSLKQHLEFEKLVPGATYTVRTFLGGGQAAVERDASGSTQLAEVGRKADENGNLVVDIPLGSGFGKDFKVPFAEGQDEYKATVENKVSSKEVDAQGKKTDRETEILVYPAASTSASEKEKQTLSFLRESWEPKATTAASTSKQEAPAKRDTQTATKENPALAQKVLTNGTPIMKGGDVAPGSPAQQVGVTQDSKARTTTTAKQKPTVSLNPAPKDKAVTIESDAGITGGKLERGAVVVDRVSFKGLRPDSDYALKGELICVATNKSTGAANSITFHTPKSDKPTVDGSTVLSIPALDDQCKEQVVVETLYEAVTVADKTMEAGDLVATNAGSTPKESAVVKDGKQAPSPVVAKPAAGKPTTSVRVIKTVGSPSTVTTTGSVREQVGAAMLPSASRVVITNIPSGPVGLEPDAVSAVS